MNLFNEFIKSLKRKKLISIAMVAVLISATLATTNTAAITVFNSFEEAQTVSASKKLPIYSVQTDEKKVAISFDAAWGADDTDNILQILDDYGVSATFFLCGYWVDKYPDEVKNIVAHGNELGNHSNTHPHGNTLSKKQMTDEISAVNEKVYNLTSVEMNLFRAPYGEYNNTVLDAASDLGYYTIQWDVDSLDWMNKGVDAEVNQVLNNKNLGNGSIILFHNDAKYTPEALPIILDSLQKQGYEIVPVSELIYSDNYYIDNTGRQIPLQIDQTEKVTDEKVAKPD